jgi:hypothetical protein
MSQIYQVACVRCGGIVNVPQATGVGACPRCQAPSYLQAQAAHGAAPGYAAQGYPPAAGNGMGYPGGNGYPGDNGHAAQYAQAQMARYGQPPMASYSQPPAASGQPPARAAAPVGTPKIAFPSPLGGKPIQLGGMSKGKLVASALALSLAGVGVGVGKSYLKGKRDTPGRTSIAAIGIKDQKKVDPDQLIEAVRPLARRWKSDAEFRGINISGLRHDGTVDMDRSTITVTFYSPSGVASLAKSQRDDSVKKFVFNDDYVSYDSVWGATKPWTDVVPTPRPGCTMKQVGALIPDGKQGQVILDPNWGFAYHLAVDDPKVDTWIDIADCQPLDPGKEGDQE